MILSHNGGTIGIDTSSTNELLDSIVLVGGNKLQFHQAGSYIEYVVTDFLADSSSTNELIDTAYFTASGDSLILVEAGDTLYVPTVSNSTIDDSTRIRFNNTFVQAKTNYVELYADSALAYRFKYGQLDMATSVGGNVFIGNGNTGVSHNDSTYYHTGNIAIGVNAFSQNVNTTGNVAIGAYSLAASTSGPNTAVGNGALGQLTTGSSNTALGYSALSNVKTGIYNVGIGQSAIAGDTAGSENVAIGFEAGWNAHGSGNIYIGFQAGQFDSPTAVSNRLIISNQKISFNDPLIYGEFDNEVLQVNGTFRTAQGGDTLTYPTVNGDSGQVMALIDSNGTLGFVDLNSLGDNLGNHTLDSNLRTAGNYISADGDDEGVYIDSNGWVGIDTNAPVTDETFTIRSQDQAWGMVNTNGNVVMGTWLYNSGGGAGQLGTYTNHRLEFITNNSSAHMIIDTNGNVGIGTPATERLSVFDPVSGTVGGKAGVKFVTNGAGSDTAWQRGLEVYNVGTQGYNDAIIGVAWGAGGETNQGVWGVAQNADVNKGVVGSATGTGSSNIGGEFSSDGASGQNYGIYSKASGADSNYAAYFESGAVYVGDSLIIPTGAGAGKVLVSDALGNARWDTLSGAADNLGDHIATENIQTNGFYLSNDGDNEGVFVDTLGKVGIGVSQPRTQFDVNGRMIVRGDSFNAYPILGSGHILTGYDIDDNMGVISSLNTPASAPLSISGSNIDFRTGGNYHYGSNPTSLTITNAGDVGIGGTPNQKFTVFDTVQNTSGMRESMRFNSTGAGSDTAFNRTFSTYNTGTQGTNTAIYGISWGNNPDYNYGIEGVAQNGGTWNTGTSGWAISTTTGINYGVYGQAMNSSAINRGVVGVIAGTTTGADAAVYGIANGAGYNTALYGRSAVANVGGTNVGLYTRALNADTNYAAYFESGAVYVGDSLIIPSGAGAGKVLTSDAFGNAYWDTIPSSGASIPVGLDSVLAVNNNANGDTIFNLGFIETGGASIDTLFGEYTDMELIFADTFIAETVISTPYIYADSVFADTVAVDSLFIANKKFPNPNSASANDVLSIDGSGNMVWTPPSVGSSDTNWTRSVSDTRIFNNNDSVTIGDTISQAKLSIYANNVSTGNSFGAVSFADGGDQARAIIGSATNGAVESRGVQGYAGGSPRNIGVIGQADAAIGDTAFAIYGEAFGAGTLYAGYFGNGNVFISDTLILPTNAGAGKVLTSDANGYATWQPASGAVDTNYWDSTGTIIHPANLSDSVGIGTIDPDAQLGVATVGNVGQFIAMNGTAAPGTEVIGLVIDDGNNGIGDHIGVNYVQYSGTANKAVGFNAEMGGADSNYGFTADYVSSSDLNMGVAATVGGGTVNTAIYGNADDSTGGVGFAGFFENGMVYVQDSMAIGNFNTDPGVKFQVYGTMKADSLILTNGAQNGYVLTSDAAGNASWQMPTGGADTDWDTTGSYVYNQNDSVGIGTNAPLYKLEVVGAGSFSDSLKVGDPYYYGGQFTSFTNGSDFPAGVFHAVTEDASVGLRVIGENSFVDTAVAIEAFAINGAVNYAARFEQGMVYAADSFMVGTDVPTAQVTVQTTDLYGIDVNQSGTQTGDVFGVSVFQSTDANGQKKYGMYSDVSGDANENTGLLVSVTAGDTNFGIRAEANDAAALNPTMNIGVRGTAIDAHFNYGVQGIAGAAAGDTAYGVYGTTLNGGGVEYAGYFANGNVVVNDTLILPTGAGAGKVLTSDANGKATWELPSGGSDSDWDSTVANNYLYNISQSVYVGDTNTGVGVGGRLNVVTSDSFGVFSVINGVGNPTQSMAGLFYNLATSPTADQYGIGAASVGTSGFRTGVWAIGRNGDVNVGIDALAETEAGNQSDWNYGVYSNAFGGDTNVAVYARTVGGVNTDSSVALYASASGTGVKYSGYFDQSNVYINDSLGIGVKNPAHRLDVAGGALIDYVLTDSLTLGNHVIPKADTASNGDVLSFDGTNIVWAPASGGADNDWDTAAGLVYNENDQVVIGANSSIGFGRFSVLDTGLVGSVFVQGGNNGSSNTASMYVINVAQGTGENTGMLVNATSASASESYGIRAFADSSNYTYGVVGAAGNPTITSAEAIGVKGQGMNLAGPAYGVYAGATSVSDTAYGLYAKATTGTGVRFAGYFDDGDVYIKDTLRMATGVGKNGHYLRTDATGKTYWDSLAVDTCPSGFTKVNNNFCILSGAINIGHDWFEAADSCSSMDAKLPSWSEWYTGTQVSGVDWSSSISWEWIDQASQNNASIVGGGLGATTADKRKTVSADNPITPSNSIQYRCVYHLKK
ncbi:MAG: hypothetical protein R2813_10335 [Flavobacteriales bacterium]